MFLAALVFLITKFLGLEWPEIRPGYVELQSWEGVLVPVLEELLFRGFPLGIAFLIHKKVGGNIFFWVMGISSSLLFGLVHITNYVGFEPHYLLVVSNHTLLGFVLYWMARTWGLGYSILYHLGYNGVLTLFAKIV